MTSGRLRPSWLARIARSAARALWFAVIPALGAGLVLRYLVPRAWHPAARGWARAIAELGELHALAMGVLFFVGFGWALRSLSVYLPGNEVLLSAPPEALPSDEPSPSLSARDSLVGTVFWLGGAALVALGLRAWVVQPYEVLSGSMLPTAEPGAYLLVNKLAYGLRMAQGMPVLGAQSPRRGDVIVFDNPAGGPEALVKRVIGLAGDQIEMQNGPPEINGWKVPHCLAGHSFHMSNQGPVSGPLFVEFLEDHAYLTMRTRGLRPRFGPYRVKEGEVFVLGDSRTASIDSRAWSEGKGRGVPFASIRGRVDRFAVRTDDSGDADLGKLLSKLGTDVETRGIDRNSLRDGIRHCLATRPKDTFPPKSGQRAPNASASAGGSVRERTGPGVEHTP